MFCAFLPSIFSIHFHLSMPQSLIIIFNNIILVMREDKNDITSHQKPPYFQSQSSFSSACAIFALNHLIGGDVFSKKTIDNICKQLFDTHPTKPLVNPYKSVFGGDYDVSVLISALKKISLEVRWLKANQNPEKILENTNCIGLLLNFKISSNIFFSKMANQSGNHWTCLKKIGNQRYVSLDSLKKQPCFYKTQQMLGYIDLVKAKKDGTVLVVDYIDEKLFKESCLAFQEMK